MRHIRVYELTKIVKTLYAENCAQLTPKGPSNMISIEILRETRLTVEKQIVSIVCSNSIENKDLYEIKNTGLPRRVKLLKDSEVRKILH